MDHRKVERDFGHRTRDRSLQQSLDGRQLELVCLQQWLVEQGHIYAGSRDIQEREVRTGLVVHSDPAGFDVKGGTPGPHCKVKVK
jgi:hypothetical protein